MPTTHNEVEVEECILFDGRWKKLQRISITRHHGPKLFQRMISFTCCPNVKVVKLIDLFIEKELDLSGLKQIRILEILTQPFEDAIMGVIGIEQLTKLRVFIWTNIGKKSVKYVDEISSLRSIQVLQLQLSKTSNILSVDKGALSLDLRKMT